MGFSHESDEVINSGEPFVRQPKLNRDPSLASAFSNGIIESRGKIPYLSLSDVALTRALIGGNEELYLLGEKAAYEANGDQANRFSIQQNVWNDEGREELFRRMNDLFTTKSRSYRVHLKAEYKKGIKSRMAVKVFDVTIIPKRDPDNQYRIDSSESPEVRISNVKR